MNESKIKGQIGIKYLIVDTLLNETKIKYICEILTDEIKKILLKKFLVKIKQTVYIVTKIKNKKNPKNIICEIKSKLEFNFLMPPEAFLNS